MKKIKLLIFIFLTLILTGCGAQVEYKTNINTSKQSMIINIEMTINEDDYQYIKGGREKFISIIKENLPKDLIFSVDKNNNNLYKFDLLIDSYQDYQTKYKTITNQDSKSIFEVSEFTDESPFKATQNIEMKDDMKYLLDWLKNALMDSGTISKEYKDKLIRDQHSSFYFNDKSSSNQVFKGESIINIIENNINVLIKKDNRIDFNLSFLILEETDKNVGKHIESYLKSKGVSIEKNEVINKDIKCMKYDLKFNDLNLLSQEAILQINEVLGNGFILGHSSSDEEKSFFQNTYKQDLVISFDINKLFNLDHISVGNIEIDVDGVTTLEKVQLPLNQEISSKTAVYNFHIPTTYTSIQYITILIVMVIGIVIVICIRKYLIGKDKNFTIANIKGYYSRLEDIIFNSLFESQIDIEDNQIVGNHFIISIRNVDKVDYGKNQDILISMKKLLLPIGLSVIFYILNMELLSNLVFVFIIVLIIIIIKINYQHDAIELELSSGKKYFFVLDDNMRTKEVFQQLLDILENNNDINEEFINQIKKKEL